MKFITLVENLKRAVSLAEKATTKNLTLPILSNLLIQSDKGQLKISATDLEIGLNVYVMGKIEEDNDKITVSAKTLNSFLTNLNEEKISLETKNNNLRLKSGSFEAIIQGISAEEFPIIPQIKTEKHLELNIGDFINAFNQVINSAAIAGRPELNGVLIKFEGENLKLVATDSYRLSEKTILASSFKTNIKDPVSVICPLRTSQEVLRIAQELKGDIETVKIYLEPNQIFFDFNFLNLISRVLDGNFPDYEAIIPRDFKTKLVFNRKSLIESVKITGLFSSRINDLKLKINPKDNELKLEAEESGLGHGHSELKGKIDGEALEISFNYRYLLDGLNNLNSSEVFLGFNDDNSPALIKAPDDKSYLYILMPIKI